jgi:predicted amidohydrolase
MADLREALQVMAENGAKTSLRIGLASARNAATLDERLQIANRMIDEAGSQDVAIVCFPETYLPGLRGQDFDVPEHDQQIQRAALANVQAAAKRNNVAVIMGIEWESPLGRHNTTAVIGRDGSFEGFQTKNQLPLEEAPYYVPDGRRKLFEIDGVPFGITICHEGWRYPEATRWAATRGAKIVFHPQLTGSDNSGPTLKRWGDPEAPYYEKAMVMRANENQIYFASVNNAFRYQESATSLIGPEGDCLAYAPYGEEFLLVHDVDLTQPTGLYASRFDPSQYPA